MVSEPSELNIVYAVVQCTGHHMGKSGTKTLHVITPLKDVYKRNVVIKSSHAIGYSQCSDTSQTHVASMPWSSLMNHWPSTAITIQPPINNNVMSTTDIIIRTISITTLMIIITLLSWHRSSIKLAINGCGAVVLNRMNSNVQKELIHNSFSRKYAT